MYLGRLLSLSTVVFSGLCPLLAQSNPDTTLTITATGTIGAVLSGSDPLGASGESGMVTVVVGESLSPTKTTATSAMYTLPPGAITVMVGSIAYTTKTASSMRITLPAKGPDVVVLSANGTVFGIPVTVVVTVDLKHGSFPASVLMHPALFKPMSQVLTAATSTTGTGSKIQYTSLGSTTVLGFSGTVSDKAAEDPLLPEEDSDR